MCVYDIALHGETLLLGFSILHTCAYVCVCAVTFGTLKVQSFMLTEVRDCDLLIVVTSSTFLKRKEEDVSKPPISQI